MISCSSIQRDGSRLSGIAPLRVLVAIRAVGDILISRLVVREMDSSTREELRRLFEQRSLDDLGNRLRLVAAELSFRIIS